MPQRVSRIIFALSVVFSCTETENSASGRSDVDFELSDSGNISSADQDSGDPSSEDVLPEDPATDDLDVGFTPTS